MGKTRETANITAENLVSTNIASDFLNVGTGITMYGGSVGVISATSFYGSASNLTGLTGVSHGTYGSSGATPVIAVDSNGRITGISTAAISSGGGGGVTTGKAIAMSMVFGG